MKKIGYIKEYEDGIRKAVKTGAWLYVRGGSGGMCDCTCNHCRGELFLDFSKGYRTGEGDFTDIGDTDLIRWTHQSVFPLLQISIQHQRGVY